jgi:23S rRNA (pseudouridine1915-N3)-methyltransferase
VKVVLRAVGRLRDRRLDELCGEYLDRARRHLPIEVEEVERDSHLLRGLPAGAEVIALDPKGKEPSTDEFVAMMSHRMVHGRKTLVFLIGGAEGLSAATRAQATSLLSLTRLTLPHRLARVLLCEQLYRALSSIAGEPYNK